MGVGVLGVSMAELMVCGGGHKDSETEFKVMRKRAGAMRVWRKVCHLHVTSQQLCYRRKAGTPGRKQGTCDADIEIAPGIPPPGIAATDSETRWCQVTINLAHLHSVSAAAAAANSVLLPLDDRLVAVIERSQRMGLNCSQALLLAADVGRRLEQDRPEAPSEEPDANPEVAAAPPAQIKRVLRRRCLPTPTDVRDICARMAAESRAAAVGATRATESVSQTLENDVSLTSRE